MTTTIQRKRGTTVQHSSYTGPEGEYTVDTDKNVGVVHDGSTAGGFPMLREGRVIGGTRTPTGTADAAGETGEFSYDDDYVYVKTSAGWKRAALSTF